MKFEIAFIRVRESSPADKLPSVTVFYVYGAGYVEKSMFFDPSVQDGLVEQLFLAGLEAARTLRSDAPWSREDAKAAALMYAPQLMG